MLWVNLIMDSLGSLALATEPPYDELLDRQPTKRNESIINGRMWKHIIMQSLIQIILLIALYLWAPYFIEEDNIIRLTENRIIKYCYSAYPGEDPKYIIHGTKAKWESSNGKLIGSKKENCGKYMNSLNLDIAYDEYINANDSTTHMTLIFNIFVYYTLFNQINCRVIDDSFNIFVRINRSFLFILICLAEMCLQLLIIFIGKSPFHIINQGLTGNQWGICIGFSAITFVVSFITKLIPIHNCIDNLLISKENEENEENKQEQKNIEADKIYVEKKKIKMEENGAVEPEYFREKTEKRELMHLSENNLNTQGANKKN
jgi:magnesium-transporting ATPase (P-type)